MKSSSRRISRLLERLAGEVLVGDGAMGTLLYGRGVSLEACFEALNLDRPELVRQVHQDYLGAGAELVETNTFAANALRLSAAGLEGKVGEINRAGALLAREAAGPERFVAGAVGPLGRSSGEKKDLTADQKRDIFREQMLGLAEGEIDIFLLETFASLDDLEIALEVAKEVGLPAVAQMAFLEEGRTREGVSAEEGARRLAAAGAAALGANCGSGPRELARVLSRLGSSCSLPLSAFPNSGFPQYVDGRYFYLATPEYFARKGQEMVRAGASLVGGCCGTTPDHIRALAAAIGGMRPGPRAVPVVVSEPEREGPEDTGPQMRGFLADWGRRPVVTVELDPPRGLDCDSVLRGARRLADAGVDAISLAENPLARIRMGNIALARQIQQESGLDVIVHVTCRDRNLIGLHSELMGAHLLGIRTVLAVTGDPVSVSGEGGATSVFDLNSVGLLELISSLNAGRNLLGTELGGRTDFLAGAAFNPNLPSMEGQLQRLKKKIAAGARYVQTQPVYSTRILRELLDRTEPLGIPVLVGILPLVSERNAEFLHNEVPGITLPDDVRQRMRGKSGTEGVREGIEIAAELIAAGRDRVGGWYIMPPFGKVDVALELQSLIRGDRR